MKRKTTAMKKRTIRTRERRKTTAGAEKGNGHVRKRRSQLRRTAEAAVDEKVSKEMMRRIEIKTGGIGTPNKEIMRKIEIKTKGIETVKRGRGARAEVAGNVVVVVVVVA